MGFALLMLLKEVHYVRVTSKQNSFEIILHERVLYPLMKKMQIKILTLLLHSIIQFDFHMLIYGNNDWKQTDHSPMPYNIEHELQYKGGENMFTC